METIGAKVKHFDMYDIDNAGRVFSYYGGKKHQLVPYSARGYCVVDLRRGKKRFPRYVHRLVAETFCEKVEGKDIVCHKDGDKKNNSANNLYWGTQQENINDSVRMGRHQKGERNGFAILNEKQARVIKHILTIPDRIKHSKIAEIFGIKAVTVSSISIGKSWKHIII